MKKIKHNKKKIKFKLILKTEPYKNLLAIKNI